MEHSYNFSKFFGSSADVTSLSSKTNFSIEGNELQRLINPIEPEVFVEQYFGHHSLFIPKTNEKECFRNLFSLEELKNDLARGHFLSPIGYSVHASFQQGTKGKNDTSFDVSYEQVGAVLDAGATICVTGIHLVNPKLNRFARSIKAQLNFFGSVGINCYLSPNGAGFNTHYDSKNATSIQIEGQKTWLFAQTPEIKFPRSSARLRDGKVLHGREKSITEECWEQIDNVDTTSFDEVTLQPGDVLCIPAGAWHSARAKGYSLALNLYFEPHSFVNPINMLLANSLRQHEAWRSGPPATLNQSRPKEVHRYFEERLSELKQTINSLSADNSELWRLWYSRTVSSEDSVLLTSPQKPPQEIYKTDVLSVRDGALCRLTLTYGDDNRMKIVLYHGNLEISMPPSTAPLLHKMLSVKRFKAETATSWISNKASISWCEVQKLLKFLCHHKVLSVETENQSPSVETI